MKLKWRPYDGMFGNDPFWVSFLNAAYQVMLIGIPIAAVVLACLGHPISAVVWMVVWAIGMGVINFWKIS